MFSMFVISFCFTIVSTNSREQVYTSNSISFFFQTNTKLVVNFSLRDKCPYSGLFWSVFSRIRTEYGEILRISPYSVRMRENTDQNNSEYGHFLHSVFSSRFYHIGNLIFLLMQNINHFL